MTEVESVLSALNFIIPVLERYGFRWVVTGGFATYVYGVDRPLTDIDIDVDLSVHDPEFQRFIEEMKPYMTQPLLHFVDQYYDDYSVELTIAGVVIDICPMREMNIKNNRTGEMVWIYKDGFPLTELVNFHGMRLSLLAKSLLIRDKTTLMRDEFDQRDIDGLKKLL